MGDWRMRVGERERERGGGDNIPMGSREEIELAKWPGWSKATTAL